MDTQDPSDITQINKTLVAVLVVCFLLLYLLACATVSHQPDRECLSPQWPFCAPQLPSIAMHRQTPHGDTQQSEILELSRQRGGPTVTPWNTDLVEDYFRQYHSQRNPAKFLAVVHGPSHAHVCQFQVTHVHFSAPSQVSEWQQLFSQPALEEA